MCLNLYVVGPPINAAAHADSQLTTTVCELPDVYVPVSSERVAGQLFCFGDNNFE